MPTRPGAKPRDGPERERQDKQGGRLGERVGGVDGRKRTQNGQPEGGVRGSGAEHGPGDAPREIGQEQAAGQFKGNLDEGGRSIVFHPEEAETGGQKERVAGQSDEGGVGFAAGGGERIAAMEQQVFCQAAVDERVAVDLEEMLEHPQAQAEAGGEGEAERSGGSQAGKSPAGGLRLTQRGSFHTIRTV